MHPNLVLGEHLKKISWATDLEGLVEGATSAEVEGGRTEGVGEGEEEVGEEEEGEGGEEVVLHQDSVVGK